MTELVIHNDPPVSEAQRRAMYAAAEGTSNLGIPQSVGREFIAADSIPVDHSPVAAGICYVADGQILLLKRGNGGDYPGMWAFPGGHIEEGETAKDAAIREFMEETGHTTSGLSPMGAIGGFSAFSATGAKFDFTLSDESEGGVWTTPDALPEPMHPDCLAILQSHVFTRIGMNELDIAHAMSSGSLPSPQRYGNVWLFDIRITGTGVAYRSANKEFTFRSPSDYLTDEFVARCNGLPVILEHPEDGLLDSDEFKERSIGTVLYPYVKGDEVWGVAKIYDDASAKLMSDEQLSTSPSVVTKGDAKLTLDDGSECTIEGKPYILDHIAVCEVGVWDKGGPAAGVNSTAGASMMTEDEIKAKADADAKELEQLKADNAELQAKNDALTSEMMADKAKKDSEEAEAKAKADAEAEEKAKADSDLRNQIADLKSKLPAVLSDEDMNALSSAQAKADSVLSAFGEVAPRPIAGETPLSYRRRLATKLKAHSKVWANEDLSTVADSVLAIAEATIYADAHAVGSSPASAATGGLRAVNSRTPAGHMVVEYRGDSAEYMKGFAANPQRLVGVSKHIH